MRKPRHGSRIHYPLSTIHYPLSTRSVLFQSLRSASRAPLASLPPSLPSFFLLHLYAFTFSFERTLNEREYESTDTKVYRLNSV